MYRIDQILNVNAFLLAHWITTYATKKLYLRADFSYRAKEQERFRGIYIIKSLIYLSVPFFSFKTWA